MKWVNIVGITLQFFAFWFAAPELLGPDALKRFETGLTKFISALPTLLITLGSVSFGIGMAIYGTKTGLEASKTPQENVVRTMITIGVLSVLMMTYIIFFAKRTQQWMSRALAAPLIQRLITKNEIRKSALIIGAILFTFGFFCQLISALLG